jgi:hypothetical protein
MSYINKSSGKSRRLGPSSAIPAADTTTYLEFRGGDDKIPTSSDGYGILEDSRKLADDRYPQLLREIFCVST